MHPNLNQRFVGFNIDVIVAKLKPFHVNFLYADVLIIEKVRNLKLVKDE